MKITGYRLEHYPYTLDRPLADCNYPAGNYVMHGSLLFIDTDEGLTGLAPMGGANVESLFHLIEGEDPRGVVGLWMKMNDYLHKGGNRGAATGAIAAIDVALWDLKAKIADEPLWQTLGAREGRVKAYASGIAYSLADDELFAFYRRMAEQGIDSAKVKVGLDLEDDRRRLGAVHEALSIASPRPRLMIDSNEYWSPKQAVRYINSLEEDFDLTWVEEPARRWDYDGLRLVSQQVSAAVATGENLNTIADFYPLIANQAVDMVNISAAFAGFTGCRQVGHMAHAYELPVTMMNCQANFMAHMAAALPNHSMMEVVDPGREHCIRFGHTIEDGFIHLSDDPGLGLEIDTEKLAELQANPPDQPSIFPFPRREGAGLYIAPLEPGEVSWR
ncbi:MAG: mandelate racemase/muconate lactonizing enzyme family protein [Candidatus Latescibacteria bacterium]|nr:mandelate racemase/muconate lactonizing enzyme family protein [Candidatus Latescibacterota bacterium]